MARDGTFVSANAEALRILGLSAETLRILGVSVEAVTRQIVSDLGTETIFEDGRIAPVSEYPKTVLPLAGRPAVRP